jgi:acyl-CoA reductase-like NAD-dependent aldehyde dehydrogenase
MRHPAPAQGWPLRERLGSGGDGTIGCDLGPIVTEQARDRITGYIAAGEASGAELLTPRHG